MFNRGYNQYSYQSQVNRHNKIQIKREKLQKKDELRSKDQFSMKKLEKKLKKER